MFARLAIDLRPTAALASMSTSVPNNESAGMESATTRRGRSVVNVSLGSHSVTMEGLVWVSRFTADILNFADR